MIPAFCYGMGDAEIGAKSSGEVTGEFLWVCAKFIISGW